MVKLLRPVLFVVQVISDISKQDCIHNQRFHRADSRVRLQCDVRKLQSMDVLKLQSTKADWNTKCPFHILTYIYSNLSNISTSYFMKILSYREKLDVDSQRIKNAPFIWISGVKE